MTDNVNINIIEQKAVILDPPCYWDYCKKAIAYATRVAYRSENSGETEEEKDERDNRLFLRLLHPSDTSHPQHTSTFEHKTFSVKIITDRAIANEIIRHRHTAFTQESTRYVNMDKRGASFIMPYGVESEDDKSAIKNSFANSYATYLNLLKSGILPQNARDVLPLGLATTMVMSTNITQWRSVFKLRCDEGAHPKVRSIMFALLSEFNKRIPSAFKDLYDRFSPMGIIPCRIENEPIDF
jgi:thymidylate synthase (FAD)